jgi:hypothetical protein
MIAKLIVWGEIVWKRFCGCGALREYQVRG